MGIRMISTSNYCCLAVETHTTEVITTPWQISGQLAQAKGRKILVSYISLRTSACNQARMLVPHLSHWVNKTKEMTAIHGLLHISI